jgi:hypothetical protein
VAAQKEFPITGNGGQTGATSSNNRSVLAMDASVLTYCANDMKLAGSTS